MNLMGFVRRHEGTRPFGTSLFDSFWFCVTIFRTINGFWYLRKVTERHLKMPIGSQSQDSHLHDRYRLQSMCQPHHSQSQSPKSQQDNKKTTKPLLNMFERLAASDASVLSTCQVQARAPRQVFLSNVLDGSRRSCLSINLWYSLITWPTWPLWFGTRLCLAAWHSPGTLCRGSEAQSCSITSVTSLFNLLALWKELPLTPQPALWYDVSLLSCSSQCQVWPHIRFKKRRRTGRTFRYAIMMPLQLQIHEVGCFTSGFAGSSRPNSWLLWHAVTNCREFSASAMVLETLQFRYECG